jgi:hypothetical protein
MWTRQILDKALIWYLSAMTEYCTQFETLGAITPEYIHFNTFKKHFFFVG